MSYPSKLLMRAKQIEKMVNKIDKALFYLTPLAIIGVGFMNMVAYYFNGHHNDTVRWIIVWGTLGILLVLLGIKFLRLLFASEKAMRKRIYYYSTLPLAYLLVYVIGIVFSDIRGVIIKQFLPNYFLFALMFCSILVIVIERRQKQFFALFKWYNLIILPLLVFYMLRLLFTTTNAAYEYINLGKMSYMDIAYLILPFMILLCIDLAVNYDKAGIKNVGIYLLLFIDSGILWLSSTKGAILGGIVLCMGLVIYACVNKTYRSIGLVTFGCIVLGVIAPVVIQMNYVTQEPGVSNRQEAFVREITVGGLVFPSLTQLEFENEIMRKITGDDKANILEVVKYSYLIDYEQAFKSGVITEEEYIMLKKALYRINNTYTGGRLTLWVFAVKEFLDSPFIGNGPLHYANLGYGYPHNILLELASDFGSLGILIFILAAIVVCKVVFSTWKSNIYSFSWALPVIVLLTQKMVSSSLYSHDTVCLFGLATLFSCDTLYKRRKLVHISDA